MMEDTAAPAGGSVPPEKLVKVYLNMREARDKLVQEQEAALQQVEESMKRVKMALLEYCKEQNIESVRTGAGMFYRSVKQRYWTNDWESMGKFVVENNVPELLEKRLHQGNTKTFLEQNPDLLPPGLNVDSEFTITVRKN
jgi:hypothetical protein